MISEELREAIDCLQIQDVYLRRCQAHCADDFEPKYDDAGGLSFQTRHFVKESSVVELNHEKRLLRVFIEFGARWIDERGPEGEEDVKALVEAQFVAEYSMSDPLEQASVDAFSLQNASYHVWPYWREWLNNQCARMHLPRVVLPAVQLARNRDLSVGGEAEGK